MLDIRIRYKIYGFNSTLVNIFINIIYQLNLLNASLVNKKIFFKINISTS